MVVHGLLTGEASLGEGHRLQVHELQELQHMGSVGAAHGLSGADFSIWRTQA